MSKGNDASLSSFSFFFIVEMDEKGTFCLTSEGRYVYDTTVCMHVPFHTVPTWVLTGETFPTQSEHKPEETRTAKSNEESCTDDRK